MAVEIASNVVGRSLHDDSFEDFWSEAERLQVPIFIHAIPPTSPGACRRD